jgi:hypothetical protein
MNATAPLTADTEQIRRFVGALFRYADDGSFVSLRAFHDDANAVFHIDAHRLAGDHAGLVTAAATCATRAARAERPVVFAPPIATFSNPRGAAEADLQNGLALSVECDQRPGEARRRLEALLGPATIVVASGGEWLDPETGELEPKLHLHWRLTEPTRDAAAHAKLKLCRSMAKDLVGADGTSSPMVHPMRWPGSWHRKAAPRLVRIAAETESELDLDDAQQRLREAWDVQQQQDGKSGGTAQEEPGKGEPRETAQLIAAILTGADYHAPITALAMRYLKGGMPDAQAVLTLRGIMQGVPEALRDTKDGIIRTGRWQARYDNIPRAVCTARLEIDTEDKAKANEDAFAGVSGIERYRLDAYTQGDPPHQPFLLQSLMPLGKVGLVYGPGGVGKSLTMLLLCLMVAIRTRFDDALGPSFSVLGATIPREAAGASVFLTLEDDGDEIHRRIASLDPENRRENAPCYVIPLVDLPEFDPALVVPDGRMAALTQFAAEGLDQLLTNAAAKAGCPVRLLVLDPAGDFLNADENDATFVKLLMRHLRRMSAKHGCTIILLGHVAKSIDPDGPSMRGSSAWIANSRFAFALWPPLPPEAEELGKKAKEEPRALVWGNLVKANHAGAPTGQRRLFRRCDKTGRLLDITARLNPPSADDHLLYLLVSSCAECAAAGLPFSHTGVAGLWNGNADLPEPLAQLSRGKLEALGKKALDFGLLVKARTELTQGAPKYLDVPDGPLATGKGVEMFHGSRQEALARYRAGLGQ